MIHLSTHHSDLVTLQGIILCHAAIGKFYILPTWSLYSGLYVSEVILVDVDFNALRGVLGQLQHLLGDFPDDLWRQVFNGTLQTHRFQVYKWLEGENLSA